MRPYLKNTHHKNRAGGVSQGEGPEFKPQYQKNKNKKQMWSKSQGNSIQPQKRRKSCHL
jgi:hypothetical protein